MTSYRPYLIRALYDWIVDNTMTPHILVNASIPGVEVPSQHIRNGQIVLNLSPSAVAQLDLGNDAITCNARFGGKPQNLHIPTPAVLAIYARENGQGMAFGDIPGGDDEPPSPATPDTRPKLRVVK